MTQIKTLEEIALLYICDTLSNECLESFSKSPVWSVSVQTDISGVSEKVKTAKPELVIFDCPDENFEKIIETIVTLRQENKPGPMVLFVSETPGPGPENRLKFLEAGGDDVFIRPFLIQEVFLKSKRYLEGNELLRQYQQDQAQQDRFQKDFDAIQRQLKKTQDELIDEKDILNNSLKQINKMTNERENLINELQDLAGKLAQNMEGFTNLLAKMIQVRVEKNKGHAQRVKDICLFVANLLKISENELKHLKTAAILHEVGLLLFPGKETCAKGNIELSQFEKDFFIQSPVKGADLLRMCPQFEEPAEIIQNLHENVDGTGIPQGLKKKNIPLLSRILAGADMLDTLYDTEGMNCSDDVLMALETSSGQRLDPIIVSCLEKYVVSHPAGGDSRSTGIGISALRPGMILAAGLFTATGTKLFSVNTLLNEAAIDKIIKYNREYPVEETVYIKAQ